jgi:trans-aconitate 3-methyltransferase
MVDPTFRNYALQQAASYEAHRRSYSSDIYEKIISYHTGHGGSFSSILDVGCGTGKATRKLASCFSNAVGCDPGEEMIAQARKMSGEVKQGNIRFEVCAAENHGKSGLFHASSVDLLTAAMDVREPLPSKSED